MKTINERRGKGDEGPVFDGGNVLIGVLVALMLLAGLATPLLMRALRDQQATSNGVLAGRLLAVAESGLHYNFANMRKDVLYCVRDTAMFTWDADGEEYVSADLLLSVGGDAQQNTFRFRVRYSDGDGKAVEFADRADPTEDFKTIRVTSRAGTASVIREIAAYYEFGLSEAFDGAVISDMIPPIQKVSGGKGGAKYGNLVFDGKGENKKHAVFGDLKSNGVVVYDGSDTVELTDENAGTYFLGHRGVVRSRLSGTTNEIPDFTEIGDPDQLFDFHRFKAASEAGAGAVYNNLAEFATAVNLANASGRKLEGIQTILIDPSTAGGSPKLDMEEGVNATGTLMFLFAPGTPANYKIVITAPVNVNAADLSSVNYADESTYTTAYPPVFADTNRDPKEAEITAAGFRNFTLEEDLPAILFSNGIVDFHGAVNVSGVVYGPSFIEIENKQGLIQYINGSVIGGGGIYFQADSKSGMIAVRHDSNTTNVLAVADGKGQELRRIGYTIIK